MMKKLQLLFFSLCIAFSANAQFVSAYSVPQGSKIKPTYKDCAIWIDANDYSVGTLADGTNIVNKGNNGTTFEVEGATLEVQLDANGKKEFEFNGSYIRVTAGGSALTQYHNTTNSGFRYDVYVIGKFGTSSNPDTFFSVCGNNGSSSTNIGFALWLDNRVATAAADRGVTASITNGTISAPVYQSRLNNGLYNTDISFLVRMDAVAIMDQHTLIRDGDIMSMADIQRSTSTTTSGLGTPRVSSASAASQTFNIGAVGNGTLPLAAGSTMKQFVVFDQALRLDEVRGVDAYFGLFPTRGNTTVIQGGVTRHLIANQYLFAGLYYKTADRSKTGYVSSIGTNHFTVGTDRDGIQTISTDDGITWPAIGTVFSDGSKTIMPPYGGINSTTGTVLAYYSKWPTATGVYSDFIVRRSTDGGSTWGSEISITMPTTVPALTGWLAHDYLIQCNNGDTMIPLYAWSGSSLYKIYVARSTDDGLTHSFTELYSSPTAYINEPSGCSLGGNNHLVVGRIEAVSGGLFLYKLFTSADDGATWSDRGNTTFGGRLFAHPAMVRSLMIDGTLVVAFGWVDRLIRRWHFKFATAADVIANGPAALNSKTTYTVFEKLQGSNTGWISGYPNFIDTRNDLNMEGVWTEELTSSTTRIGFQYFNDEIKTAVKAELGI